MYRDAVPLTAPPALLALLDAPGLVCGADGVVVGWNEALADVLDGGEARLSEARVHVHGRRGLLMTAGGRPVTLTLTPIAGGGWLGVPIAPDASGASAAVAQAVARRLRRLETSVAANAAMGLHEQPDEPVAACLRELLAAAQELRVLASQVDQLAGGGTPPNPREAVCLGALAREAVAAVPPGVPVRLARADGDVTVHAERARLFSHLVALLHALGACLPDAGGAVEVEVASGDPVRLDLLVPGCAGVPVEDPAVEDARAFVSAHGGRLLVDGGRVMLELPAFAAPADAARSADGTVLIVDDDESSLAMMAAVLRRAGWRVLAAENGVAASVLLRRHAGEIVAVVADAVLPGRSGVELAAEARRIAPTVPVLLVSGHPSDIIGDRGAPGLPMLSKPFGARALAERVRRMVGSDGEGPTRS
jgi:CheY-like chemotaxis protein